MTAPRPATKADATAIVTELIIRTAPIGYHALGAICCSESVASIALHESLGLSRVEQLREIGREFDHRPNFICKFSYEASLPPCGRLYRSRLRGRPARCIL